MASIAAFVYLDSVELCYQNLTEHIQKIEENSNADLIVKKRKHGNGELLFKSGFEGNVNIASYGENKHTIAGEDTTTGFDWERDLPGEKSYFIYLTGKDSPDPYVDTRIEKVIGPNGKTTNALYIGVNRDYDGDRFMTRNEFSLFPQSNLKQGYISYWMKLQADLEQIWPDDNANRMLMEWKEPNLGGGGGTNNYRFNLNIRRDDGQLYWHVEGQQVQPERETEWVVNNKNIPVPTGEWFKVEVFWRQGSEHNGRLWFAVNGEEVADYKGRTQHSTRPQDLNFWSIFKLYPDRRSWFENEPKKYYQWIDDVEIRKS